LSFKCFDLLPSLEDVLLFLWKVDTHDSGETPQILWSLSGSPICVF